MEERIAALAMVPVQTIRIMFVLLACIFGLMVGAGLNAAAAHYARRLKYAFPFGQLAAASTFSLLAYYIGIKPELAVGFWFCAILIVIVQTDLADMTIPDPIILAGVVGVVLLRLWSHPLPWWDYLAGGMAGSGFLLLVAVIGSKMLGTDAMGGGDIKLYVLIGLVLGFKLTLLSLFLSSLFGFVGGMAQLLNSRGKRGTLAAVSARAEGAPLVAVNMIPFGPYIAAGSLAAYVWGEQLIFAYLALAS